MTDDPSIRALSARIRAVQPMWHAEAIAKVARAVVADNHAYGMALDSADSLTRDINAFFRGDQAMPPSPSGAAAMPASLSPDNYTGSSGGHRTVGGMNYHRRNGNASDQITSTEEFLSAFSALPDEMKLQIFQALASHFGVEINGEAEAEDQGNPRLPENGNGVQPGEFFENQQTEGTWATSDPQSRGPSGTIDARPRTARDRRPQAADQRLAEDSIRRRYDAQQGFDRRWGSLVGHIGVWR